MDEPKSVTRLRAELIELPDEYEDENTVDLKKLSAWVGMHYETLLAMNRSNALPYGIHYKDGGRGYNSVHKLACWNYYEGRFKKEQI